MFDSAISVMKGAKLEFLRLMEATPASVMSDYIKNRPSKSDKEKYPVLLTLPGIQEFVDRLSFGDAKMKYFEVKNATFYDGFKLDFDTFEDSKESMGQNIKDWAMVMAENFKIFKDQKAQDLLEANGTAWDGSAFFATSRSTLDTGSNTINNLVSGTLSTVYNYATFSADFASAEALLYAMKDKQNKPFNPVMNLEVLIPSQMKNIVETVLSEKMSLIYNGSSTASNQYSGSATIKVNTYQSTSDNDWYLINKSNIFSPFLFQDRENIKWDYVEDKETRLHKWFYTFRTGYSYLNPFSIVKINN